MAKIYLLAGVMVLTLWAALLVPMPPLYLGLLMLGVIVVGVFVAATMLNVMRARGASLPPGVQRWAQRLGYLKWPIRLLLFVALFWAVKEGQTTAAVLIGAGWFVFGYVRTMAAWQLRQWTTQHEEPR